VSHRVSFRIRNEHVLREAPREFDLPVSESEFAQLIEEGYLVQERVIQGAHLEALRNAADEIEAAELEIQSAHQGGGFGGLFVRNLLDRHQAFLDILMYAPALNVARAAIGPQVQCHAMVLRVSYPHLAGQQVEWHFHQRVVPDPIPPFFSRPEVMDNLIYLDDVDEDTGPLVIIPGSHRWNEILPSGDFSDKPGQVVLPVPAGSMVTTPSSLWHKAMPTKPGGRKRRLLILGYSPTWMKPIDSFGGEPTAELRRTGDAETRELLGVAGYY
jgi:ectoine hydroxylase-related dioxygenase (phytanoyl-CoA dioxygenase family)